MLPARSRRLPDRLAQDTWNRQEAEIACIVDLSDYFGFVIFTLEIIKK